MSDRITTFRDFWPYYLGEHRKPFNRQLHFIGTSGTFLSILALGATNRWLFLLTAFVCGYFFAWIGHFFVEHNRPATFKYPLFSLAADFRMYFLMLIRRLGPELVKAGVTPAADAG